MAHPKPPRTPVSKGLFNTNMGPLQRQLRLGEYNLLKCATMFESDFIQVSKHGGILDVHNQVQQVRVAIAATSPGLPVPDVLLLARPVFLPQRLPPNLQRRYNAGPRGKRYELTRLLPLCFIKISIHDLERKQLRFKMVTGRTFYLQLCPPPDNQKDNFDLWVKVVHLLRPPSETSQEKRVREPWKPGESVLRATDSSATQGSEEKEISIAEVLSTLQEELPEGAVNAVELLESASLAETPSPSPMASEEALTVQERSSSPLFSEAPSESREELWKGSREPKRGGKTAERSPSGRKSGTRSKSSRSHRSRSSKRAASQTPSRISSIMGTFTSPKSRSSRKHRKERKR